VATALTDDWTGENTTIGEIESELARLRDESSKGTSQPNLRTSVMTHIAWVPPEWQHAAEETLAGMAERHPSRTLLLVPHPDDTADRIDASAYLQTFQPPQLDRCVSTEVVELHLRGATASAPASVVQPLLISDLPVFLRWRGRPSWGAPELERVELGGEVPPRAVVADQHAGGERVARRVEPGRRHPGDVRHHARPQRRRLAGHRRPLAQPRQHALDLGDGDVVSGPAL
jgi:hypothetical protein